MIGSFIIAPANIGAAGVARCFDSGRTIYSTRSTRNKHLIDL